MIAPNPLKAKLAAGGLVVGHCVMEFAMPHIGDILAPAQLDFVLFDIEHTVYGLETLGPLFLSCRAAGVVPIVRVPGFSGHYMPRALDAGALGVMMPNVETREQAEAMVAATRYPPDGTRGMGLGGAHTWYRSIDPEEYRAWANDNIVLIAQIESTVGLANVEEIAAVPGIDVAWVGHTDLSLSLGIVGQYDHPTYLDALRRVAAACRRAGKGAGIQPRSVALAEAWCDLGYNVISLATDIGVYQSAVTQSVAALRQSRGAGA
ncbi:MAG: HpcH/HpaI aldolase family protein [Anaerolineae bacterium]